MSITDKKRQAQLIDLAREGNEEALSDLFKEFPYAYKKLFGKGMSDGKIVRKKRKIARGCGAIMEKRRKKTLYI